MELNLQLTVAVYSVSMLIVNDVFVRFMIMKLIMYVLTTLIVEYTTFIIYNVKFLFMKCVIAAKIFR